MRGARPGGKRSACTTSTWSCKPRRARFSRAQASARGSWSVAITRSTPRRARIAASTPVPVPMSKASCFEGSGAVGHQVQVLAAHRREHAVVGMDPVARRKRPAPGSPRPSCATRARPPAPAVRAARRRRLRRRPGPRPRCRPRAGRVRGAVRSRSRRPAPPAACPARASAAPGPAGAGERPVQARVGRLGPCAACDRRGGPLPAVVAGRCGNRCAREGPCLRWPGDKRHRPSGCRPRPARAWAAQRLPRIANGRVRCSPACVHCRIAASLTPSLCAARLAGRELRRPAPRRRRQRPPVRQAPSTRATPAPPMPSVQCSMAWCSGGDAVREDAAAHQEHGGRAGDRQPLHQPGRGAQDRRAPTPRAAALCRGGSGRGRSRPA